MAAALMCVGAQAQTVTLTPGAPINFWAGCITTNNTLTNVVTVAEIGGGTTTNILLALSGGNGTTVTPSLTPLSFTGDGTAALAIAVTNAAKGLYSFTVSASGDASYSTNLYLFVVPQWTQTNAGSSGNWSNPSMWSGGAAPLNTDSVYIDHSAVGPWTNVVDSTRAIQDLVYLGNADDGGSLSSAVNTTITPGATLSVLGTNGFIIGKKANLGARPVYSFYGNTMVVSNEVANFDVTDASANSTRYLTVNMNGLSNLLVTVNRFNIGDVSVLGHDGNSADGSQTVNFTLAQTNIITALYADNYSNLDFNTSIQYDKQDQNANNGQQSSGGFFLGTMNAFYADSVGVGVGGANNSGTSPFGIFGYQMRFIVANQNQTNPFCSAYFRGTNGGRMSLLAVGMDTGSNSFAANNGGVVDLRGGKVDMLVNQIWLGGNKTNLAAAKNDLGGFYFDHGMVNANIIQAGFMRYTNVATCAGYLLVGTNATLTANNYIELGHTPADPTTIANWANAAASSGQIMITNGGTVLANQINVGLYSTNNVIIVAPNSSLVVSNSIGQPGSSLTTLNLNGANLTFSVTPGVTNAYLANLITTTTPSKINIASVPPGQSTNVLMVYQAANQAPNIGIGTLPPGFNNMQIVVDPVGMTVSLIVSTNSPKDLAWRGGANSQWDHASLNWFDLNAHATTKFTEGDYVTFDDTPGVPNNITIAETVTPSQSGIGMLVTNNVNSFVFTNNGSGSIGSCTLLKAGTGSLEIDVPTSVGALVNNGTFTVGATGTIGDATTASGSTFNNSGSVSGGVTCAGSGQNAGTIDGNLYVQSPGNVVNSGTVNGPLTMDSGTTLNNLGSLTSIGTAVVATNSTLINNGVIYGTSLTVAAGGTLTDTVMGSPGIAPGSINVGTLAVSGAFNPGGAGDTIATTVVTDYSYNPSQQQGAPYGRVQLNAGSTTTFKVNSTNTQPYTQLLSQSIVFGPSEVAKSVNGGTLVIDNVGPTPFAAGQTFQLFGEYYFAGANPGNAGLNSTNAYPKIVPQTPGPGLVWDLSQLYSSGTIGIINASAVQFSLTSSTTIVGGTNMVLQLSWPANYAGYGWLQQQLTALTNGLGTNWTDIGQSDYVSDIMITNSLSASPAVFYRFILP